MKRASSFFAVISLLAAPILAQGDDLEPWFNGTLLSAGAGVGTEGGLSAFPVIDVKSTFGAYNNDWAAEKKDGSLEVSGDIWLGYGIGKIISLEAIPGILYTKNKDVSSVGIQDLPLFLGVKLLNDVQGGFSPDIKLRIRHVLPLAKYENLDASKNGTDAIGSGSQKIGLDMIIQKRFKVGTSSYLRSRINFGGIIFTSKVAINGITSYGGDANSQGLLTPGKSLYAGFSLEYLIAHNWGFGIDAHYSLSYADRFTGNSVAAVGKAEKSQKIVVSPQFQYSVTEDFGLVLGGHVTIAGQNTSRGAGGTLALSYTF